VVFAQTYVNDVHEGIHAFLVRIRNEDMTICTGVTIKDMGKKLSCNGVDNACLGFHYVRIPADNLLNKHSDINPSTNQFKSSIKGKRARFLTVADQLLSGRLCIASMCLGGTKTVLFTAIKYSSTRESVGKSGLSDTPIMHYQLQQNAILPLLAYTIGLNFGLNHCKQIWADATLKSTISPSEHALVVLHACVIKPLVSWNFENTATTCRERTGGQGYLSASSFGDAIGFSHAGISAEGDNAVLMQKVAKELLTCVEKGQIKYSDPGMTSVDTVEGCLALIRAREQILVRELATQLRSKIGKQGQALYDVWMMQESDLIQAVARSFGERVAADAFANTLQQKGGIAQPELKAILDLYLLHGIHQQLPSYLMIGLIQKEQGPKFMQRYHAVVKSVAEIAMPMVDHLGLHSDLIRSPIAHDWVKYNEYDNQGELLPPRSHL
jgi:acyl-CoA oxidase